MTDKPRSLAEQDEPSITATYQARDMRLERGGAMVDMIKAGMPTGAAIIPAKVANALREALFRGLNSSAHRGVVQGAVVPTTPGVGAHWASAGVALDRETWVTLSQALGVRLVISKGHGPCETCLYGPRDRGYSAPCVSCGTGHPCHTPKCFRPKETTDEPA